MPQLSEEFIRQYARLNRDHQNGHHIWDLCRFSYQAVQAGGGEVKRLAKACIPPIDTDTIYFRRDAWVGWLVFIKVPEKGLIDEHGDQAEDHAHVRQLLSYSHFAIVGAKFRQRQLRSRHDLASFLVSWARDQRRTREARAQLDELVGAEITLDRDIKRLKRACLNILRHGDKVPVRLYRIARSMAGTDWI